MEIVLKLLDWSLRQNWALGGPIVCFIVLMCIPALRNTADNPSDRAYWRDLLRHDRPAERYRSVMRRGLDWLDSRLSAHEAPQGPAQKAWSFGLLNATMALALAYPIVAITIQWLCGSAIDFGGQEVMAASPPQARIFTAVWLGSSVLVYLFAGASKSRWHWPLVILATGILLLGSIFADRFAVPENVAFAVAFAEERSSPPMAWHLLYCGVLVALLIVAIKMPDDFLGVGAACGFDAAFCRYAQGAGRLYLVDGDAVFHAHTHPIASLCRGAHPRAAIPCRGAQFCGRSFGARRAERASGPPLRHMYLRHDHHRALVSDLDLYLRRHP